MITAQQLALIVLLSTPVSVCTASSPTTYDETFEFLTKNGRRLNPGIISRVTQSGVNYVTDELGMLASQFVPKIRFPNTWLELKRTKGMKGVLQVSNIRLLHYRPPRHIYSQLIGPNMIKWHIIDSDATVRANVEGNVVVIVPANVKGELEATLTGMDFTLITSLSRSHGGNFNIFLEGCSVGGTMHGLKLMNAGIHSGLFDIVKKDIMLQQRPAFDYAVCQMLRSVVFEKLNRRLNKLPTELTLEELNEISLDALIRRTRDNQPWTDYRFRYPRQSDANNNSTADPFDAMLKSILILNDRQEFIDTLKQFHLNFEMIQTPFGITSSYTDFPLKGEITEATGDKNSSPFNPPNLNYTQLNEPSSMLRAREPMLRLFVTDYVMNTLLYRAYERRFFHVEVGPETEEIGPMLTTNCNAKPTNSSNVPFACIGDMIPELAAEYPNHHVHIRLVPKNSPVVQFMADGTMEAHAQHLVLMYTTPIERPGPLNYVIAIGVASRSSVTPKLDIDAKRLKSSLELTNFDIYVRNSRLADVRRGDQLAMQADWAKIFIEVYMNTILEEGITLNLVEGMRFKNTELTVKDRYVDLSTDFYIERDTLKRAVQDVLIDY